MLQVKYQDIRIAWDFAQAEAHKPLHKLSKNDLGTELCGRQTD